MSWRQLEVLRVVVKQRFGGQKVYSRRKEKAARTSRMGGESDQPAEYVSFDYLMLR